MLNWIHPNNNFPTNSKNTNERSPGHDGHPSAIVSRLSVCILSSILEGSNTYLPYSAIIEANILAVMKFKHYCAH